MKYVQLALWAFVVLWQHKTIPLIDRLRLWRKTINLFACFLAFTDSTRPYWQLRSAMLCAILSTLYDYETDWEPVERLDDSLYLHLLEQETKSSPTYTLARNLFISDRAGKLSEDGLERGGIALQFYHSLIQSEWMSRYTCEEIVRFGRQLQILDDLLDIEEDARAGHKNCLLGTHAGICRGKLQKFLEGGFFAGLTGNSPIYARISRALRRQLGEKMPLNTRELLDITRPITFVFAFVLTCLGFKLAAASMLSALLFGAAFAGVTASIMVFNDLSDGRRDLLKGKRLVHDCAGQVRSFYQSINAVTGTLLISSMVLDWKSGMLIALTWAFGLLYSAANLPYPWNNLLVAACSAVPVLVGMAHSGRFEVASCFFFSVVAGAIAVREVFKDTEDSATDAGHKDTLPVRVGTNRAALHGVRLMYPVLAVAAFYPNTLVQLVPAVFAPLTALWYAGTLYCRETCRYKPAETYGWGQRAIDVFLAGYIVVFWCI